MNLAMNAVPRMVLASPLHRLMSGRYATLHFTGRKTGRRYNLPIAYVETSAADSGSELVFSTDSGWWRNLADQQPFEITLYGQRRGAVATIVTGEEAADALRKLVALPGYAKKAGIEPTGGVVSNADIARATDERVVMMISVNPNSR